MPTEKPHILAQNLLQEADSVSSSVSQDAVYRLVHLTDRSRQSQWHGVSGTAEQIITWYFSSAKEMDTFVLDRGFTLTGATIYFQHSANGSSWTTLFSISALDSDSIYWRTFTAVSKQYWRLKITGLTAKPIITNVWAGKRLELTLAPTGEFDPYLEEPVGESAQGTSGGFQRTHHFTRRVLVAEFAGIQASDYTPFASWWSQAGREEKNWWWLTYPTSESTDPLFLNCEGATRRFSYDARVSSDFRSAVIEAYEVL